MTRRIIRFWSTVSPGSIAPGDLCIYRIEYENWSNAEAIAKMKRYGYHNLDDEHDVLGYLENYRHANRRAGNSDWSSST